MLEAMFFPVEAGHTPLTIAQEVPVGIPVIFLVVVDTAGNIRPHITVVINHLINHQQRRLVVTIDIRDDPDLPGKQANLP